MKFNFLRFVLAIFILLSLYQPVTAQDKLITDGPYVFYRQGQIVVKSVLVKDSVATAHVDSFTSTEKAAHLLTVHLDQHPGWDFTVRLKANNETRPPVFKGAARTFVLSDIEGEFEPFRNLLLTAKVIDTHYHWIFGKGRLIIAGDLFDRGKQVCQFLWLLYKLEDEARAKGGDVNVVLGNHDIMNLDGDFRYVDSAYYGNAKLMNENYSDFYGPYSELGRWLRSKNTIEKIGDLLVMHGGISSQMLNKHWSLEQLNDLARPYYATAYHQIPDSLHILFRENSLFWYRGYFVAPLANPSLIDSTLAFYHCKKIIVGHDIIDHVAPLYEGKVIGVDVDEHEGTHEGLLIERNKYYRIDDKGKRTLLLVE